jgi:hypothetical protein
MCALIGMVLSFAGSGSAAWYGDSAAPAPVPPIHYGVADDASKYADDGGAWFYGKLTDARLSENRWTLAWDSTQPTTITELAFLERAAPKAEAAGIHIVLALYSAKASDHDPAGFCTWAAGVATLAKGWGIHDFIVWNEPNTRLYWTPQSGAGAAYEALLAQCYDTIHAADAQANVIGMGLSPRASTSESTEPLVFLRDVGAAYRASGRTTPIMDQLAIHPYPNPNNPTASPDVGYEVVSRYGIPNLDRVKQAVYDAFDGTGQPTTLKGLTFRIDEVGWQTDTTAYQPYVNAENVAVIDEATQVQYLKTMTEKYFACDPTVTDVELFLLVDEKYRNGKDETGKVVGGGWQSGLLTAGGEGVSQPKQAYTDAGLNLDRDIGRAACRGGLTIWTPQGKDVVVDFGPLSSAVTKGPVVLTGAYRRRSWQVSVTASVPYRYEFGPGAYEHLGWGDWSRASGQAPAGTRTIEFIGRPVAGPLLLRIRPIGSDAGQDFRSARIDVPVGLQATLLRVYRSGRIGDLIANPWELDNALRIMSSVVALPPAECGDGGLRCTVSASLRAIADRTGQSVAAAHGTAYNAAIALKPGARGRPKLDLQGLQPGRYRLTVTVVRGGKRASLTTEPVLLDAKGRIVKKHTATKH